ncbi:DsrE family protein [Arundinibacter roseus]|uniref:Uncharacterized protein n=1 Tax=Arundinibacter roseus TaxID=2070510 RepID=A0A4R4KDE8_9BACT|nr:DsrE family protein [Arundinibacter roseus]TDB65900.1 hypothetical protein EZE20_09030 [Arundinibacter roseus]
MKKVFFLLVCSLLLVAQTSFAQSNATEHRVVFHLSTSDTLAHKALIKQLSNVLAYWNTAKMEVVIHNNGIGFMQTSESGFAKEIAELQQRGVTFAVCENTLRQRKIDKANVLPNAVFVPVGIAELVLKQEAGWAYIKAGF